MSNNNSFQAERRFFDDVRFPYGFARSGDFTITQAVLLETHGNAYIGLASGERKPLGQLEKNFVTFCQGKKEAESGHEKVWKKYQEKINGPMHRYSLTYSASKAALDDTTEDEADTELDDA